MANRRMFSLGIVDTDLFLDMPLTAQALYFHLGMRADDDGFVSSPKKIIKVVNCSNDDLELLIAKGYIIPFDSGIVVLTHWKQHNYIQSDRYRKTVYKEERSLLELVGNVYRLDTSGEKAVSKQEAQYRLSKDIVRDRVRDRDSINTNSASVPDDTKKAQDKTKQEANELFEKLWELYPSKKGKGRVSDTQKKKLLKIGLEELTRAIDRYKDGLNKDEWRKPQNGSTFFNSGYVDYLDENWQPGADNNDPDYDAAAWQRAREQEKVYAKILEGIELDPELFPNG